MASHKEDTTEELPFYGPLEGVVPSRDDLVPPAFVVEIEGWRPIAGVDIIPEGGILRNDKFAEACRTLFQPNRFYVNVAQLEQVAHRLVGLWGKDSPKSRKSAVTIKASKSKTDVTINCSFYTWDIQVIPVKGRGKGAAHRIMSGLDLEEPGLEVIKIKESTGRKRSNPHFFAATPRNREPQVVVEVEEDCPCGASNSNAGGELDRRTAENSANKRGKAPPRPVTPSPRSNKHGKAAPRSVTPWTLANRAAARSTTPSPPANKGGKAPHRSVKPLPPANKTDPRSDTPSPPANKNGKTAPRSVKPSPPAYKAAARSDTPSPPANKRGKASPRSVKPSPPANKAAARSDTPSPPANKRGKASPRSVKPSPPANKAAARSDAPSPPANKRGKAPPRSIKPSPPANKADPRSDTPSPPANKRSKAPPRSIKPSSREVEPSADDLFDKFMYHMKAGYTGEASAFQEQKASDGGPPGARRCGPTNGPPPPHRRPQGPPPPHPNAWKSPEEQKTSEENALSVAIQLSYQDMQQKETALPIKAAPVAKNPPVAARPPQQPSASVEEERVKSASSGRRRKLKEASDATTRAHDSSAQKKNGTTEKVDEENRAYLALRLSLINENGSSLLSTTPMEGVVEEEAECPTDIVVESSEGGKFRTHKTMLAAASPTLKAIMDADSSCSVIRFTYPTPVVRAAMAAIYSTEPLNEDLVENHLETCLSLASEYQLLKFQRAVHRALLGKLNIGNLKMALLEAQKTKDQTFKKGCLEFAQQHAREVLTNRSIICLATVNPELWDELVDATLLGSDSDSNNHNNSQGHLEDGSRKRAQRQISGGGSSGTTEKSQKRQ